MPESTWVEAESDRGRWDRKYAAGEGPTHFRPDRLLVENSHRLGGGRALDVACGFGGSALYLATQGYRVEAIDASGVALARAQAEARRRGLGIDFVQADLAHWRVPRARYDLITVFYYLNRELVPHLAAGLRPGGLLFQATRNWRYLAVRPGFDPTYLLQPGELCRLARDAGLDIDYHADGTSEEAHRSQLIARQPI